MTASRKPRPHGTAHVSRISIRFADVDHARTLYFPRQLHLVHVAMEDFFREAIGIPYAEVLGRDNIGFPTVHLEADFRRPLRFGDEVDVTVDVEDVGRSRVVFRYTMTRVGDAEPAARFVQTTVAVNTDTWTSVPLPEPYRTKLAALRPDGRS